MTNAVRPARSVRSARSILRSVPMSTDEVASSRTRIRGSASSARAKATSWRWPSERREPALAELGVVAVLELPDEVVGADRAGGGLDLLVGRVRAPEGDVLADRAGEEEALLRDDPELAPERGLGDVAEVDAVDRDPAVASGRRSGRAAWRSSTCPAPVWPTSATVVPGGDVEVDAVQHLVSAPVGEADALEADVPGDRIELAGAPGGRAPRAPRRGRR